MKHLKQELHERDFTKASCIFALIIILVTLFYNF